MYKTIAQIKKANNKIGHNFFSKGTMKFFGTKVFPKVYGGRYFITEENQFDETHPRKFNIRVACDGGEVRTVGEFNQYATFEAAEEAVKALVASK